MTAATVQAAILKAREDNRREHIGVFNVSYTGEPQDRVEPSDLVNKHNTRSKDVVGLSDSEGEEDMERNFVL